MKDLKKQAREFGKQAFINGLSSVPAANKAFISWLPNGSIFEGNKSFRSRADLYKQHSIGWTVQMLNAD